MVRLFKKTVPIKDGVVQLTHDDLFLMHVYHFEPFFSDDLETIYLFTNPDYNDPDVHACGYEEVNQNESAN